MIDLLNDLGYDVRYGDSHTRVGDDDDQSFDAQWEADFIACMEKL